MIESASPAISRKAIKRELLEAKGGVASELPSEAQLEKMQVSANDCLRAPSEAPSSLPPSSPTPSGASSEEGWGGRRGLFEIGSSCLESEIRYPNFSITS